MLNKMSDTKATSEVKALEGFYTMLQCEPSRAFYGLKHVAKAIEAQAVEVLLISDNLFRWVRVIFLLSSNRFDDRIQTIFVPFREPQRFAKFRLLGSSVFLLVYRWNSLRRNEIVWLHDVEFNLPRTTWLNLC